MITARMAWLSLSSEHRWESSLQPPPKRRSGMELLQELAAGDRVGWIGIGLSLAWAFQCYCCLLLVALHFASR